MKQFAISILCLQVTYLYCAPIHLVPQMQPMMQWPQPMLLDIPQNGLIGYSSEVMPQTGIVPQMSQVGLVSEMNQIGLVPQMNQLVTQMNQMSLVPQMTQMNRVELMPQINQMSRVPGIGQMEQMPQVTKIGMQPQMVQIEQMPQMVPGRVDLLGAEQMVLQEQMMALQQWQTLLKLNAVHAPSTMDLPQAMLLILPNQEETVKKDELTKSTNPNNSKNETKHDAGRIDEELESVVIENPQPEFYKNVEKPPRAVLILPNRRFSIGGIISSIPWLPFEVNVPDTIAWGYNGISNWISNIISIIGQRLPFRKPQATAAVVNSAIQAESENMDDKLNVKLNQSQGDIQMPILVVPLSSAVEPFQIID